MKKILALILAALMLVSLVACGNNDETTGNDDQVTDAPETDAPVADVDADVNAYKVVDGTLGDYFFEKFVEIKKADPTKNAETVVNEIMSSKLSAAIQFPMVMPVEAGYLSGFEGEFSGFKAAHMFAPGMMGVAFVGYVFDLEDGADVTAFMKKVEESVDPRWNGCTEAEMTTIASYKNSVLLVMCPEKAPSAISGIADVIEPNVTAGSASETVWNEFKNAMAGNPMMIAAEVVDALSSSAFEGEVNYIEDYFIENDEVFVYTIDGFNNAATITSGDKTVYVIQLDEGMDVANWASYYFDGIKAESSSFGAYNNTLILMVNVG
jgi:hypothetical protein